ncbi:MAG: MFS transporter [bacterium]
MRAREEKRRDLAAIRGTPAQGLAGATLGFFFGFAAVALFGPTAERLRQIMDLPPILLGFLVAAPTLSGSLLRIPFSAWVDTTGGRKPFLVLLSLSIAGMAGLSLVLALLYPDKLTATYYPLLFALGALCGCGIATFSVGISQVAYWYQPARHGTALGAYAGIGNLAPGLFSFILPIALASIGLVGAYLAWLAFLVLGTVLYALLGRNAWYFQYLGRGLPANEARGLATHDGQRVFPSGKVMEGLRASARIWQTWVLVALYFTTFGGFLALTAWLPTYWSLYYDFGLRKAGALTAAFSLLASVVRVYGGSWADRWGGENTSAGSAIVLLAGSGILTFTSNFTLALAGTLLIAIGMGVNNAAVFKMVPQYARKAIGGASGWVGGLGAFGGFAIPPLLGLFVNLQGKKGYATGFVTFIGLALAALGLAVLLRVAGRKPPIIVYIRPR